MATILIADDNSSLRQMLRRILEKQGHNIVEACHGEAAIQVFQKTAPDLAILDVDMGEGINGYDVCRKLREDSHGLSIPIIFLTGMSDEENVLQGFQEGADDYVKKPFSLPELIARVTAQIGSLKRRSQIVQLGERQFCVGSTIKGNDGDTYTITKRLSSGGMGVIFRGYRISDSLEVAIKTLSSTFLENYKDVQRFLREANATVKIQHPNLASGLEVVRSKDHCFFVMKYVEGESLASILNQEFISQQRALAIVTQIADGLQHLHQLQLVHRDIKPGNILVTQDNRAVLVDFGLTKGATMHNLTTEGIILGTPYYLSPEQALGESLDIRSDIYSLGATFYHAITGTVPFHGSSTIAVINARFIGDLEQPHQRIPEISPQISRIITKMMERSINDRYQNPGELLEDLQNVKFDKP